MLRGIRAKIRVTILGILVLCGSAVVINTFADANYEIIYAETDLYSWHDSWQNIVELDGVNGSDFSVSLSIEEYYYIVRDIEGYFTANEGSYITADSCNKVVSDSVCDVSTGHFHLENDSDNTYYNVYTVHYTVSPDTPAGVYDLAIHTENYLAQADDEYVDLSSGYNPETHLEIIVKRPQEIIFEDSDGNPITEITKYLGDEDFIVNKHTISGEGDISDYYIDYGADEEVVEIMSDSDYFRVIDVGTTRICAWADEAGLYTEGESCFTVNVEKKPILTYSMFLYDEEYGGETVVAEPIIVELNGTDDARVAVDLEPINTIRLLNLHGYFATSENSGSEYGPHYINATDFYSMSICEEQCGFDVETGSFYYEFGDIDDDGNWFDGGGSEIARMIYTISSDTPAGVYNVPIVINDLQGRNMDDGTDFDEEYISFENVQIVVRRPQNIVFRDHDENPITEVSKTYGDSDFEVTKEVYYSEGDGEIIDYYIESSHSVDEGEGNVVDIVPNSDYIHINKAGSAEICAVASETEFYLETTACYTINVENKEIWVKDLTVADKRFDGNSDAEIDELTFYALDSEDNRVDINIDPAYYYIDKVELNDPNVGETTVNIEIHLTTEGYGRYYLSEAMYTAPATVLPAIIQTITQATVDSQEYDPTGNCQSVPIHVEGISAEDLEFELYEGTDFKLLYEDEELDSNEVCLTDVGDYDLTVVPIDEGNFTFEPFEATFTITPKIISITSAEVNEKEYDRTSEASVRSVSFGGIELIKDADYSAYASLDNSDAGTWSAIVYVTLINHNYSFSYDDSSDSYEYQDSFDVNEVEILPRTLTYDNTYYDFEYLNYYTGEEIKPFISLSIAFVDGEQPEDPLTLDQDYTIEYSNDTVNAGLKYATLNGKGNFRGSIGPIEYYISAASVQDVQVATPSQTYTGEPLEPEPAVTAMFGGNRITLPTSDYEISDHEDFVNAGTHIYTIQESNTGNYHFSNTETTFTITPYEISSSNISLSEDMYKYNGTSQTPSVTVTVEEITIDEDDYDIIFSADTIGNDEGDTEVTVTVTAKEGVNITGSASATYIITPRDVLTITGIDDNQRIEYTGLPVTLDGDVIVEENEGGITAEDLTITWYASDGTTVIEQPTNAGSYKVVYSYEDADYHGVLVVNFEITKVESPAPAEMETEFRTVSGQTLADLEGERTNGFVWVDSSTTIIPGNNVYPATYTYNNDAVNYETLNLNVPIYGLSQINVTVPASEGGEITISDQNVLEGETVTVTITPDFGYILSSITVNGVNHIGSVEANTLTIVAGTSDLEIVATFVPITYEIVEGAEQVYTIDEDSEAKFKINATYGLFENDGAVYVDDTLVAPGNYTSWDGSTYIQLAKEYVDTLAVGTHTLKIVFNDGGTATTTFTIAKSDAADDGDDTDDGDDVDDTDDGDDSDDSDDGDGSDDIWTVPDTGFSTMISGGATATISLLAVIMAVLVVLRKDRR